MNKKTIFKMLAVLLIAAVLAGALAVAAIKAYSLYTNLSRKMDYANSVIYSLEETVDNIHHSINREFSRYSFDYSWIGQTPPLVAHAFGGIDGYTYTNSIEAFEQNYALGHRIFEVDFDVTETEYTMIAAHDEASWREKVSLDEIAPYSYDNFISTRIYDRYTPMDYRNVIDLLVHYPDIYIVTDTKYTDLTTVLLQFSQLVKYAEETDASVLDRIIPQIYHEDMLGWVMSVYPFKSAIYTLYYTGSNPQAAYDFCEQSGIRFITAPQDWINSYAINIWDALNITVAAHTVNSAQEAQQLKSLGVDLFYTDFLTPTDL